MNSESSQRRRNARRCGGAGRACRSHWSGYSKAYAGQEERRPKAELEASIRKALEADPQFAEAHGALAAVLGSQGKFEPAEEAARQAVKLRPDNARAHLVLGFVLMFQGKLGAGGEGTARGAAVRTG